MPTGLPQLKFPKIMSGHHIRGTWNFLSPDGGVVPGAHAPTDYQTGASSTAS